MTEQRLEVMGTHPQAGKDNIDLCKYRASKLNGREYGNELTDEEKLELKDQGIIVVFGHSDDNVELKGRMNDETGGFHDGAIYLTKQGLFEECEENCIHSKKAQEKASKIEYFHEKDGYLWTFETTIRHETFDIFEDGEKFCRGIVFHVDFIK